jgi:putative hydroxymethylpyrimidine transport system substrate-binding protein
MLGAKPILFLPEEHGVPAYDELIVLARRDDRGDARYRRFVAALQEGSAALLKDPEGLWAAFAAAHTEQDTKLTKACWGATLPAIARDPGRLDAQRYLDFEKFALASGIIPSLMPLDMFAAQILG